MALIVIDGSQGEGGGQVLAELRRGLHAVRVGPARPAALPVV